MDDLVEQVVNEMDDLKKQVVNEMDQFTRYLTSMTQEEKDDFALKLSQNSKMLYKFNQFIKAMTIVVEKAKTIKTECTPYSVVD